MRKSYSLVIITSIFFILLFSIWRGCRFFWSPHYLANDAVFIDSKIYNSDSSVALVYYNLDVGARGIRGY